MFTKKINKKIEIDVDMYIREIVSEIYGIDLNKNLEFTEIDFDP